MTGYAYRAYGLVIHSALELQNLSPAGDGPVDVTITLGEAANLDGEVVRFSNWQATPGRFLIDIRNVARFLVTDGRSIHVETAPGANHDDLVAYLLGSALAALLQQRRILPIHASAIRTDHGAVLIAAASGVGKSTLAAALQARGLAQLADDVTGIVFDGEGRAMAVPAFPGTRLWPDSVRALGRQAEEGRRVRAEIEKIYLPITNFCSEAQPVRGLIALSTHNRPQIRVEPFGALDRAAWIVRNTFRKRFMNGLGLNDLLFQASTDLARQVQMVKVVRPSEGFALDALADRVVALLQDPADWAETPAELAS